MKSKFEKSQNAYQMEIVKKGESLKSVLEFRKKLEESYQVISCFFTLLYI